MSGIAATLIQGQTTHSALHLNTQKRNIPIDSRESWRNETRLLIIDEISFASKKDVEKMHDHICFLKDRRAIYGGIDVIFCGDFRQLEPCDNSSTIYETEFPEWHIYLNCYLELRGMHRFRSDLDFGRIMFRWREGNLTLQDVHQINTRVIKDESLLPPNIRYATYTNQDRAAINAGLFAKWCNNQTHLSTHEVPHIQNCIAVLCSDLRVSAGKRTYVTKDNAFHSWFWENCGEGNTKPKPHHGRFDPALMI